MKKKLWISILIVLFGISQYRYPVYAEDHITDDIVQEVNLDMKEDSLQVVQAAVNQRSSYPGMEAGNLLDFGTGTYIYEYGMKSVTIEYNGQIDRAILMEMFLHGERVYCIEPEVHTQAGEGYSPGFLDGILTYEEQRRLGLISYFGYGYGSDYSAEMSAATMVAIWMERGRKVTDLQASVMEKVREIQRRVDRVDIKPSFANQKLTFKGYGEAYAITLTDQNSVLEDYYVYQDGGYHIEQQGNTLKVWLDRQQKGSGKIIFDRIPRESLGTSIVYVNANDYQKLMRIYPQFSESMEIHPSLAKAGLRIGKRDEDGVMVPDTTFEISYHEDMHDPIGTYTTDQSGYVMIPQLEPIAVYIREQSVPEPYVVDAAIERVNLVGNETAVYVKENRYKKGHVRILKKDAQSGKEIALAGVGFAIYTGDHQYVTTVYTDETGTAYSGDLRYGDYYFKEINAPENYLLSEDRVAFEIRTDGEEVIKELSNQRVKAEITIEKQDMYTFDRAQGEASLDGAVYGLYAQEDIHSPDDQHIVYHKDELIMKQTIVSHKAFFQDLLLGKYYVKEISPSPGYTLDTAQYPIECLYEHASVPIISKQQVVKERVKSQAFQLIKVSSNGTSGEVPLVQGAQFTIKAKKDVENMGWDAAPIAKNAYGDEAEVLITDEKGYACSQELPYGSYIVRETSVPEGMLAIQDFQVHIHEDAREPQVWRVFNDAPIQAHIKVIKIDADTGKAIPSPFTRFKIKNLDTGEYVKFWIKYPAPMILDTFETTDDGSFTTPEGLPCGRYQVEEMQAPYGYVLDNTPLIFEIDSQAAYETMEDGSSLQIVLKKRDPQVKGRIQISKEAQTFIRFDEEETEFGIRYKPVFEKGYLDGVKFDLYAKEDIITPEGTVWYHANEYIETLTTTADGPVISSDLPLGSYYLKETQTKEGYILDEQIYDASLSYENQLTPIVMDAITIWNEKEKGMLEFTKQFEQSYVSSDHEAIKHTILGVYTRDPIIVHSTELLGANQLIGIVTLDEAAKGHFNFDFAGRYYVKELQSDDHYVLDDTEYDIIYEYQNLKHHPLTFQDGSSSIQNYLYKGCLMIEKRNPEGIGIAGVQFELSRDQNFSEILTTQSTNTEGNLIFESLEYGTYYVREKETGDLYILDDTIHEIHIQSVQEQLYIQNEYRISSIKLKKLDDDTRCPLENVEFTLYDDEGKALDVRTTNEQGIILFDQLKNGVYLIKETNALPGYVPLQDSIRVEIKGNDAGKIYEYEVTNQAVIQTGLEDHTGFYSFGTLLCAFLYIGIGKRQKQMGITIEKGKKKG